MSFQLPLQQKNTSIMQAYMQDILNKNELRHYEFAENMQSAFWILTADTQKVIYVNQSFEIIWQLSCLDFYKNPTLFTQSVHPNDRKQLVYAFYQQKNGTPLSLEYRIIRPDQSLCWLRSRSYPVLDENEEVQRYITITEDISQSKQDEEATRMLASIVENSEDAIIGKNLDGTIITWNQGAQKMFGYEARETLGKNIDFLIPEKNKRELPNIICALKRSEQITHYETFRKHRDNHLIPISLAVSPIKNIQGKITGAASIARDITRQKENEEQQRLAQKVFENSNEAIMITDPKTMITHVNDAFCRMTGYTRDEVLGKNPKVLQSGHHDAIFYNTMWEHIQAHGEWQGELWDRRKSGEPYPTWASISTVKCDTTISHYVCHFADITTIKKTEARLERLAHYDMLTGLPNRFLFQERLDQALQDGKAQDTQVALMFLDLDHFKNINDTLGHSAGDNLLKKVAERLIKCKIRETDTVVRLGGDEFTIILRNIHDTQDAVHVAERILDEFKTPFDLLGQEVFVTTSIGITMFPNDAENLEHLLKNADTAMYYAKEKGKNTYQFFSAKLNNKAKQRMDIERNLRKAVELDAFQVFYQPRVNLKTNKIIGAEALIRSTYPGLRNIGPDVFIPIAEENGLIEPITDFVLNHVCTQLQTWQEQGLSIIPIAINFSSRMFLRLHLIHQIQTLLKKTKIPPTVLEIELTESSIMKDVEIVIDRFDHLNQMGIQLAIDDFGTGYSSLNYLRKFSVNALKIDKSFVRDLTHNPDDTIITRAIIALAHTLGMRVIAEGVETQEQLELLKSYECDEVQGFYFSPPVPTAAFQEMLS